MYVSGPWYASATTLDWTAIAVAVVCGVPGFVLWWNRRKRLLVYTAESASLLLTNELESSGAGDIEISLRGRAVDDPYLVSLTIACHSHRDIRETDFGGKPLVFHFGVPIIAAKFGPDNQNPPEHRLHLVPPGSYGPPSDMVEIEPSLIRKGRWCRLHLITEGGPDVKHINPIADVTVRPGTPATPKRIYATIGIQAGCLIFLGGIIVNRHPGWLEVAIAIALLLVATVIDVALVMLGADDYRKAHQPP